MKYPTLYTENSERQMVDTFKGYNHNLRIGDGEFFDMKNMTSDCFPVLSPRGSRGVYQSGGQYTGLIEKDALCYVKNGMFYINKEEIDGLYLNDQPKQLVSMGAYVIILPDKVWVNTTDFSFGYIEAFYPGVEVEPGEEVEVTATYEMCQLGGTAYGTIPMGDAAPEGPSNMQQWIDTSTTPNTLKQYSKDSETWVQIATTYIKISARNIAQNFSRYDAVKITGFPDDVGQLKALEGQTFPLWEVYHDPNDGVSDYIVIVGLLDKIYNKTTALRLERTMPEMDFVIESGNRLWGCRYGLNADKQVVNEIYCSKLGDFRNWSCFMGISTDSWTASLGTDGQFTGAISHLGYPLFFKENCIHKVYGSYPANFQVQTTPCNGVQKGSGKSLAIVNTTLFYKGRSGICAYDGSLPTEVSQALGNVQYSAAVGGAHGSKYYISMTDSEGKHHLFVFDTAKGMWHREDDLQVSDFCACRGELYANCGGVIRTMLGSETKDTEPVEWMAETGEIGISSPDAKYISRLTLRMSTELGAEVRIYAQYDFSSEWEHLTTLQGTSLRSFSLPVRPRRCDHMKLRIEGIGQVKIYSITKTIEGGSELP